MKQALLLKVGGQDMNTRACCVCSSRAGVRHVITLVEKMLGRLPRMPLVGRTGGQTRQGRAEEVVMRKGYLVPLRSALGTF